ncbi:MAG: type IV pilus assembly protein PilM [Candidatus Omnitrophota bacterium]|nr:type IV pilus assembly protein PilM [Candidatus Omnitrophota bacterium]
MIEKLDTKDSINTVKKPAVEDKFSFLNNKFFKKEFPVVTALFKKEILPSLKNLFTPPQSRQNIFGLDIGTSSVKLIQIIQTRAGLELANLWSEQLPFSQDPDANKGAVKEALKKIISANNIKGRIVTSVGGGAVNIQAIKIPFMPEDEIAKALEWEAQEGLSIDLETTAMDYVVLGETEKSGTRQIEILLITVPKAVVSELVNTVSELGLIPHAFEPPPLAVIEAFGQDELKAQGHVVGILELGAGLTNFSIVVDGALRFTRNIPIASSGFTDDIAEYINIDKLSAEKLKIKCGLTGFLASAASLADTGDEAVRVAQAMNFKLEKLVSGIEHTFKFYLHQLSSLNISNFDKLILSGGGALIKDLDKFLSGRLNVPVTIADPFKKVAVNENKFNLGYLKENAPRFTLVVGLALRKDGF